MHIDLTLKMFASEFLISLSVFLLFKKNEKHKSPDKVLKGKNPMVETRPSNENEIKFNISSNDLSDLANFYVIFLKKVRLTDYTIYKNEFIFFFEQVRSRIPTGKRICNPEILIPMIIYVFLRMKLAPLTPAIYANSNIMTKSELSKNLREYLEYIPEYQSRNRRGIIQSMLKNVSSDLNYPDAFLDHCYTILDSFWKELSNTTERVCAATIFCLTLIYVKDAPPPFKGICDEFGVEMSTLIYQIKIKLLKRHNIKGFTTLRRSLALIKQFLLRNL